MDQQLFFLYICGPKQFMLMSKNETFLYFYFYYLEELLQQRKSELGRIKFQSEEANTDEFIKRYLKDVILENPRIPSQKFTSLTISNDNERTVHNFSEVATCIISEVFLPEELTERQKRDIMETKRSVYTNPDLYLKVSDGQTFSYHSLEIKTTKNNTIPGSSVQQVSPYEWTVFIKHSGSVVEITTGFYLNAITDKLPFPDRSPRPQIGFDTMQKWNRRNRAYINKNLSFSFNGEEQAFKLQCLKNWEEILCKEWMGTIRKNKSSSEKWFNNTIRMFSLELLKLIKENPKALDSLIEKLERNIN